jgi:uncharacterized protein
LMQKPEQKKIEPSIEEILASIRRIIAEDGLPENTQDGSYEQMNGAAHSGDAYDPIYPEYDFGSFGGANEMPLQEDIAPAREDQANVRDFGRTQSFSPPGVSRHGYEDYATDDDLIYMEEVSATEAHRADGMYSYSSISPAKVHSQPDRYEKPLEERIATIEDEILELTEDFMIEEPSDGINAELDFAVVASQIATMSAGETSIREVFFQETTAATPSSESEPEFELLSDPEPELEPDTIRQVSHHASASTFEDPFNGENAITAPAPAPFKGLNDALASVVAEMRRLSVAGTPAEPALLASAPSPVSQQSASLQTAPTQASSIQRPVWSARCLETEKGHEQRTENPHVSTAPQLTEEKQAEAPSPHLSVAAEIMALGNTTAVEHTPQNVGKASQSDEATPGQASDKAELISSDVERNKIDAPAITTSATSLARHAGLKAVAETTPSAPDLPVIKTEAQATTPNKPQCQAAPTPSRDISPSKVMKNRQVTEEVPELPREDLDEVSAAESIDALNESAEKVVPLQSAKKESPPIVKSVAGLAKAEPGKIDTQTATVQAKRVEAVSDGLETKVKEMLMPLLQEWLDEKLPHIIAKAMEDCQKRNA